VRRRQHWGRRLRCAGTGSVRDSSRADYQVVHRIVAAAGKAPVGKPGAILSMSGDGSLHYRQELTWTGRRQRRPWCSVWTGGRSRSTCRPATRGSCVRCWRRLWPRLAVAPTAAVGERGAQDSLGSRGWPECVSEPGVGAGPWAHGHAACGVRAARGPGNERTRAGSTPANRSGQQRVHHRRPARYPRSGRRGWPPPVSGAPCSRALRHIIQCSAEATAARQPRTRPATTATRSWARAIRRGAGRLVSGWLSAGSARGGRPLRAAGPVGVPRSPRRVPAAPVASGATTRAAPARPPLPRGRRRRRRRSRCLAA
jgi:hypothetical protein